MKRLLFFNLLLLLSYFYCSGQDMIDISKYNRKQKAIIALLQTNVSEISSTNTHLEKANGFIEETLPLFSQVARIKVIRKGNDHFYYINDYLQKAKLLKIYTEIVDIEFDKKNKVKSLVVNERNDVNG